MKFGPLSVATDTDMRDVLLVGTSDEIYLGTIRTKMWADRIRPVLASTLAVARDLIEGNDYQAVVVDGLVGRDRIKPGGSGVVIHERGSEYDTRRFISWLVQSPAFTGKLYVTSASTAVVKALLAGIPGAQVLDFVDYLTRPGDILA